MPGAGISTRQQVQSVSLIRGPGATTHPQFIASTTSTARVIGPNMAGSPPGINSSGKHVQPLPAPIQALQKANQKDIESTVGAEEGLYKKIIDVVYQSVESEPPVPKKPLCPLDCGCRAIDMISLMCKRDDAPLDTINNLTPILRRGRSKGWMIHNQLAFPLTNICGRTMWVASELIMVFLVLGLSIARYSCGNNEIYNILHLALSIFASVLGVFDVFVLFCGCPFVRCGAACSTESSTITEFPHGGKTKCRDRCLNASRNSFDIGRIIMSEIIFYPILICAMFEFIASEAYYLDTRANQISCALFVTSAILMLAFVNVVQIAVPISAISNFNKKRFPPLNTKSVAHLQRYFILYTFGQIVVQILMIMGIGITLHNENREYFEDCGVQSIEVSGFLWYMLVAGFILPIFGLLNFYFLTYYWVQEFSIGICIDFVSNLPQNDMSHEIKTIYTCLHFSQLTKQFEELKNKCFCNKFFHPFQSPLSIVFSFLLLLSQAAFFIFSFLSLPFEDSPYTGLFSFPWVFWFLVAAATVVFAMNIHSAAIVIVWSPILLVAIVAFIVIIAIIAATVILIIALVLLIFIFCNSNGNRN